MKKVSIIFLLISTFSFGAQTDSMPQSVLSFYNFYLKIKPMGIPEQKDLKIYEPYLSTSLRALLLNASRAEEKYRQKTKGEAPPLIEGDIFTSLFEGATRFKIISSDAKINSCSVDFFYDDADKKAVLTKWTDRIFCVKESSGWRIDDIEYGGTWQFMHRGKLKDLLKNMIQEVTWQQTNVTKIISKNF